MRKIAAGRIRYQIAFVANPSYQGGRPTLFSDELIARIRRQKVPEWRVVYFDGRHSRREEINVDYGVRSLSFQLKRAGQNATTYCKEFRAFGFCVEYEVQIPPGGPLPYLAPSGEMVTIAGLRCRKGEYQGRRHLFVWYSDEVEVEDPTDAVLCLEGVPGLIMQTEEIADGELDAVERVTVAELSSQAPESQIFSVPGSYRRFHNIDAARAEDRRILDAKAVEEFHHRPLAAIEHEMFVGEWLFDSPKDKILVDIARAGDDKLRFRTTVLTAPADAIGRVRDEKASMRGRTLLVEDPPNYRLYRLGDSGRSLILADNEIFTYIRL